MTTSVVGRLVPRETEAPLREFLDLVEVWNRRINLLSRAEAATLWERHVLDSAQLIALAPPEVRTWLDMGAGAGFPGIICAVIAASQGRPTRFTFIESDSRKAAFLREAARRLDLDATVINSRLETAVVPSQDVISARALAPLDKLLSYAWPFAHAETVHLFPKGRRSELELTLARQAWHIRVVRIPSLVNPDGVIFRISEIRRRS